MKQKIKEALKTRWSNQLGIKDEKVFEGVATSVELLITNDEQLTQFVEGAKDILTQPQSYADKVRTELNAKLKEAESAKAELEAKLNGNNPPDPEVDEVPAWAQLLLEQNKALTEKLNAFEAAKSAELAVQTAQEKFNGDAWVNGYPELRDSAWAQAMRIYERTGKSMTAEELHTEAMELFKPLAKAKGLDITQPFQSDGGAGDGNTDFSDWDKAMQGMGWETPKEN